MNKAVIILIIVLVVILIAFVIWYLNKSKNNTNEVDNTKWKYVGENYEYTVAGTVRFNLVKYNYYTTEYKNYAVSTGLVKETDFVKSILTF